MEIGYHKKSDNRFFNFFTGKSIITSCNGKKKLLRIIGMQKIEIKIKTKKNHFEIMHYIGNKKKSLRNKAM